MKQKQLQLIEKKNNGKATKKEIKTIYEEKRPLLKELMLLAESNILEKDYYWRRIDKSRHRESCVLDAQAL